MTKAFCAFLDRKTRRFSDLWCRWSQREIWR